MEQDAAVTELDGEYLWIWRCWHRLTHERQWQTRGMSAGMAGSIIVPCPSGIPWTAVDRWCVVNDYTEEQSHFLDRCIQEMDSVFIPWWVAENTPKKM